MSVEIRPVQSRREKRMFLTFPWQIYKTDPLWVPPLLREKEKTIDPKRGLFFRNGYAEFFIAWKDGKPAGTICCAEDQAASKYKGYSECMFGFFECIDDYAVAEALLTHAERWARDRGMVGLYGPYHLDYEDSRGILIDGRDRPPVLLCGHTPPYYPEFFERYGMPMWYADGVAYAIDINLDSPQVQRLIKLAEKIRARKNIVIRGANLKNIEAEIDNVLYLTNSALAHLPGYVPWTREAVEQVIRPMAEIVDPELALFAEVDGKVAGFFPGVPNINEILIHVNGLRYPWDYLRLLWHMRTKPKCISVKTVLVPPEHWDTGVGVLLFDELARRAAAKGYKWADLSITGEDNTDTAPLAKHMGAKIYKRYRMYKKQF